MRSSKAIKPLRKNNTWPGLLMAISGQITSLNLLGEFYRKLEWCLKIKVDCVVVNAIKYYSKNKTLL